MTKPSASETVAGNAAPESNVDDDLHAYIEHWQTKLLAPGWEGVVDASAFLRWAKDNKARLTEMAAALDPIEPDSVVREHLQIIGDPDPKMRFDSPQAKAIFAPLLDEVRNAAQARGIATVRSIHLAASTDVAPSPTSLPSAGEHVLFIGPGTSSFCNYWAKAYTFVVKTLAARTVESVRSPEDLHATFRRDASGLLLASRLALYLAFFGTTLGFGEVVQPPSHASYRRELLRAMELFAVAHEFGHFVAEERLHMFRGQLDVEGQRKLERFCDEVGLALSRDCCGSSYLAFCGIGAIVLLRSAEVSEALRAVLVATIA